MYQQDVACKFGINETTLVTWELNQRTPGNRYLPRIIGFLGYDPYPTPTTLGERLQAKYRQRGLSRREASRRLGLDVNTLQYYEEGAWKPRSTRARRLISEFLGSHAAKD